MSFNFKKKIMSIVMMASCVANFSSTINATEEIKKSSDAVSKAFDVSARFFGILTATPWLNILLSKLGPGKESMIEKGTVKYNNFMNTIPVLGDIAQLPTASTYDNQNDSVKSMEGAVHEELTGKSQGFRYGKSMGKTVISGSIAACSAIISKCTAVEKPKKVEIVVNTDKKF